jgi:sugar lactone lactonase YvrE
MRRLGVVAAVLALVGVGAGITAVEAASPPHRIPLPRGWFPEGIAIGHGNALYVGSIPTGSIYRANARTGDGGVFIDGAQGRSAIGLSIAHRKLFVAGGETGQAYVYNARSGNEVATYQLVRGPTFVNDVIATKGAAWFTDSVNPVLYRVPLRRNGAPGDAGDVETVALSGDIKYQAGFNVNGIEATPNGEHLVIVQSNTGLLFKVDADTGEATRIDLGGKKVVNGDGILLDGRRLFVVQNQFNQVAVVKLDRGLLAGEIVQRLRDPSFDVPTTVARAHGRLYLVNARFNTPPTAGTRYWLTVIPEP